MNQTVRHWIAERRGPIGPAALLFCALILGGGGPHAPIPVAFLEGLSFLLLVHHAIAGRASWIGLPNTALTAIGVALAYLLCGTLQLVPLPPSTWRGLPGRHLLIMAQTAEGRGDAPWPASLSPQDTCAVLLALLPPLTLFLLTMGLSPRARLGLARLAVAVAVLSALLGVAQLGAGNGSLFPYGLPPYTRLPGFFANFNHQATLLTTAFILMVAIAVERPPRDVPHRLGIALVLALLSIGTLITSSRAGLGLLATAGVAGLLLWVSAAAARQGPNRAKGGRQRRLAVIVGGVAGVGLLALLFVGSYRADLMANRFGEAVDDLRFTFWVNTVAAIRDYGAWGSGLGTFDFVYEAIEPLSQIDKSYVNHAHNDYLELVLELGLPGAAIIVAAFLWTGWQSVAAIRRPVLAPGVALARAGGVVVLLVMAHSIVDYPLRTEAMACVFAFACALLVNRPETGEDHRVRSRVRRRTGAGGRLAWRGR